MKAAYLSWHGSTGYFLVLFLQYVWGLLSSIICHLSLLGGFGNTSHVRNLSCLEWDPDTTESSSFSKIRETMPKL
jgi:hypothetical protein